MLNVKYRAAKGVEASHTNEELRYYHSRTGQVLTYKALFTLGYNNDCVLPVVPNDAENDTPPTPIGARRLTLPA